MDARPLPHCHERARDFGGCRCQAFALTGDASATDPACSLAPAHEIIVRARAEAGEPATPFAYRGSPLGS